MGQNREVLDWLDAGRIAPGRAGEALRIAGLVPSPAEWGSFLAAFLLWLGTVALAAAMIFFFAFNWDDLGRFAKFGLVEAAIAAGLLASWWLDLDGLAGKALLVMLSLLTGALLALAGQTYQTGADSWQLFAWWALLILPWVAVGRFAPLWLIWLALLDLAAFFLFRSWPSPEALLWTLLGLNGAALIAWEFGHASGLSWLREEWTPRLVAVGAGTAATLLALWAIIEGGAMRAPAALAWLICLAALYFWYRRFRPDLFMLAGGVLSLIVTFTVLLSKFLLDAGSGALLIIALAVIGMAGAGGWWLKRVAREPAA